MKKKYLVVTGGTGFVGSNLINLLLKKTSYKIISYDNYSTGSKKNHINNKRVTYLNAHTKDIQKKLKSKKNLIKSIFHFGEFSRIYQSFKYMSQCIDSNLIGISRALRIFIKLFITIYCTMVASQVKSIHTKLQQ